MAGEERLLLRLIPPELLAEARQVHCGLEEFITRATVPVEHFYILRSGRAKLICDPPDAAPTIIALYREGDFFGEMEMVGLSYEDRSIVAMTPCDLYQFTREQFLRLWGSCGDFSLHVLRIHCKRLLKAGDDKVNAERMALGEKVLRIIRENLNAQGYFDYTKHILSEMAGVSPRSLNRVLSVLEREKQIKLFQGTIRLDG